MKAFKDYVIEEFNGTAEGYVATEFRFSHSVSNRVMKREKKDDPVTVMQIDSVKVNVKFYDKDMKLLCSKLLTSENNELPKSISKKLVNISPDELVNKFMAAKGEICNSIMNEYKNKRQEYGDKLSNLNAYINSSGNKNDVTPQEFKGESITIVDESEPKKKGKKFDM